MLGIFKRTTRKIKVAQIKLTIGVLNEGKQAHFFELVGYMWNSETIVAIATGIYSLALYVLMSVYLSTSFYVYIQASL